MATSGCPRFRFCQLIADIVHVTHFSYCIVLCACRMPWILSIRDVQRKLFGRRRGRADGGSSLRPPAAWPLRHTRLRLPRLLVERPGPSGSHLLWTTPVSVRHTVTARPSPSVPERPYLLPGSGLPLHHRCASAPPHVLTAAFRLLFNNNDMFRPRQAA